MPRSGYDTIAREYYDSRHITSRNFDNATRSALQDSPFKVPAGRILEIGAGRGRVGEFLGIESSRVVQLDNSLGMFELDHREDCILKVLADACDIPLVGSQFSAVVGFLIDPFFGLACLAEAHRMLAANGTVLFTVPTYEWGAALRPKLGLDELTTRFRVLAGEKEETVELPSVLHPPEKIEEMMRIAGFREVEVTSHRIANAEADISPDIVSACEELGKDPRDLEIIHLVRATR